MTATEPRVRLFDMDGSDGSICDGCNRSCGAAGPNNGVPGPPLPAVWFGDCVAVCFGCLGEALALAVASLKAGDFVPGELPALREVERLMRDIATGRGATTREVRAALERLDSLRNPTAQNG